MYRFSRYRYLLMCIPMGVSEASYNAAESFGREEVTIVPSSLMPECSLSCEANQGASFIAEKPATLFL